MNYQENVEDDDGGGKETKVNNDVRCVTVTVMELLIK